MGLETVCFSRVQCQLQRLASNVRTDLDFGFPALSPEQHGNPEEGLQVWLGGQARQVKLIQSLQDKNRFLNWINTVALRQGLKAAYILEDPPDDEMRLRCVEGSAQEDPQ